MQKEIKYYTPTLDEFFFGFSFEFYNSNDWYVFEAEDGWKQTCFGQDMQLRDIVNINYAIQRDKIRVKYLDKEDIENLGWVETPKQTYFKLEEFQLYYYDNGFMIIYDDEAISIFRGFIKNKSELIKLMKQLDICKKK